MILAPLWRALAVAACVLLLALPALPAAGADDEPAPDGYAAEAPDAAASDAADATDDSAAQTAARVLIAAERFDEALALLRPQVQGEQVHANTAFLFGLAALEASQAPALDDAARAALLDEAIAAFHTLLIADPRLLRVRLELARAFYFKGEDELARRHFEHVLVGGVPEPVAANVQDFLNEIRARERWRFHLGFALAPDSNIGSASAERTIYIRFGAFELPFRRDQQELTTSGIGVSVWGGAEYQVPMGDQIRLRAGGEAVRREYAGSQFDQFFLAAHLGPRWLADSATSLSLLASARQRWIGTVPDNRELGARFEVGRRVSESVTAFVQASWHERRYRTRTLLDGPVMDASLRGVWVVSPTVRADLSLGYGRERPRSRPERSDSRWLGAGVSVILPLGFTVGGGGDVRWTDYGRGWGFYIPDGSARKDRTHSLRASVHHRALTLYGFSPELVVVREERVTNAQLYDYERTRGELRFVQQF